jgi:hypothetical protein
MPKNVCLYTIFGGWMLAYYYSVCTFRIMSYGNSGTLIIKSIANIVTEKNTGSNYTEAFL